jgi:hypothetical protein
MRPYANRAPALAIEWNYRLGGYLPGVRHVRQSGIHRGGGFLSARRIECEFDERDELTAAETTRRLDRSQQLE